ncbi:hypothetical protein Acr_07g0015240 [Actinidia rufa]|uniref:Uncharacterized protein n=1 Tax=Actinidia rufa TaxID=165716 RepID=A0A7J0EY35_9ERIC|nr:hypothetical protein Acr_07g0015240 [Actinidia rufa]
MIAIKLGPKTAAFAFWLLAPSGGAVVAGAALGAPDAEALDTIGSGGSTTSSALRVGAGADAGGHDAESDTDFIISPGMIGRMVYSSFASLLEHGLPDNKKIMELG